MRFGLIPIPGSNPGASARHTDRPRPHVRAGPIAVSRVVPHGLQGVPRWSAAAAADRLGAMIVAHGLTKTYGEKIAVDSLDATVRPGRVTGFLGPNGAGKSTTMRMILGRARPAAGSVTVNGRRYQDYPAPLREVGALLEARAVHPGRSARDHLRWLAASNGIPRTRVDEVLGLVGIEAVADKRVGSFSLGMGQRPRHPRPPPRGPP